MNNLKTVCLGLTLLPTLIFSKEKKPNIVLINADDLGFGDLSCNGMQNAQTPCIDRISREGIRMTNMHSSSSMSTPSRFTLLTGEYAWRQEGRGVANGDAAMLITPEMHTLPAMLKRGGYRTAAVGKWHLGLGAQAGKQDWNGEIKPGLSDIGFDYSYIMAATADRVPCVFIEQGRVVNLDNADPIEVSYKENFPGEPSGKENPELLRLHPSHGHDQGIVDSVPRIGFMRGGKSALWHDEDIAFNITDHAIRFIEQNRDTNFFLYFATNDVHVPRLPHRRFLGKSGMGTRGDAILQLDFCVGEIYKTLEKFGVLNNTLLIITSDNGPVLDDGYADRAVELAADHNPSAWMRGGKYSAFEAGTRVPFIMRWADEIAPNAVSDALFSQVDLYSFFAKIANVKLEKSEAPDSQNHFSAFLGKSKSARKWLVQDAYTRALVLGDWKFIAPKFGSPVAWETGIETAVSLEAQLFNLKTDPEEKNNLAAKFPRKTRKLAAKLKEIENQKP